MAHASGDVPVDGTDILAGLALAHLLKGHAVAFEDAVIFTTEHVFHGPASAELQATDLLNDFTGGHRQFFPRAVPESLPAYSKDATKGSRQRISARHRLGTTSRHAAPKPPGPSGRPTLP